MQLSTETAAVVLDSTADLPNARERHSNWRVVPLYVRLGDATYRDHVELSADEFYVRLRGGATAATSQPTPGDFEECFRSLDGYERIYCLTVSAKVSGTHESALRAAEAIGGARVVVLDSASASAGEVILAEAIQRRLERGTDDAEIENLVERFRREAGLLFTVETLDYLVRGGRIGKAAGLAGNLLNVKPILTVREGRVEPVERVRTKQRAVERLIALMRRDLGPDRRLHVAVLHGQAEDEARALRGRLGEAFELVETFTGEIGPVIATHTGPGVVGAAYYPED